MSRAGCKVSAKSATERIEPVVFMMGRPQQQA
jgi:hypothetical protein